MLKLASLLKGGRKVLKIAFGLLALTVIGAFTLACGNEEKVRQTPTSVATIPTPTIEPLRINGFDIQRTKRPNSWYFIINVKTSGSCPTFTSTWTMPDGQKFVTRDKGVSFEVTVSGNFDLLVTVEGCHVIDREVAHLSTEQIY